MEKNHVYTIFLTWCQRYDAPSFMTYVRSTWDSMDDFGIIDEDSNFEGVNGLRRRFSDVNITVLRVDSDNCLPKCYPLKRSWSTHGRIESSIKLETTFVSHEQKMGRSTKNSFFETEKVSEAMDDESFSENSDELVIDLDQCGTVCMNDISNI